jgi:hypothetical protein
MSLLVLPARTDLLEYDFAIELDGTTYTLGLRWNDRDSAWYLDVLDAEENPIAMGRKVVVGFPLLGRSKLENQPPGVLFAMDTSGADAEPGVNDLGGRVQLLYQEATP